MLHCTNTKTIIDYPNYTINTNGKIFNKHNRELKLHIKNGYKQVGLNKNRKNKKFYVHRLVAMHFIPNRDIESKVVNHKDGNKLNNDVSNLEWVTYSKNSIHAYEQGLIDKGYREIKQYDENHTLLNTFKDIKEAMTVLKLTNGEVRSQIYNNNKSRKTTYILKIDPKPVIDLERFEDLKDFENLYMIDLNGNVYSKTKKIILKHKLSEDGYYCVTLSNSAHLIHRLIAKQFIPNIENKLIVNHKDGFRHNNTISNLEWCTHSENSIHAVKLRNVEKSVIKVSLTDVHLAKYDSIKEASEKNSIQESNISRVCRNIRKTAGGFKWIYNDT